MYDDKNIFFLRYLTSKAQVLSQASPYGICGDQSDTGRSFPPNALVFPSQYHSTAAVTECPG
jgi:hypothetical protein